ncbi:MAG: AAA family ATPase, partial [Planctomycetes bacterium]|nr:AAA family ATPase [Planctomycetota bacterium]
MLEVLDIRNLATIKSMRLEFAPGLNILSGMSGAGKSMILRAIGLVLGERFPKKYLTDGQEECEVAAQLTLPAELWERWRQELALEDPTLLIRRRVRADGRAVNTLNERLISTQALRDLGKGLALVMDQEESLELRNPDYQTELLDAFAGLGEELRVYGEQWGEFRTLRDEIERLRKSGEEALRQEEFLNFQMSELEKLAPKSGEFASLGEEHRMLAHSEELGAAVEELRQGASAFAAILQKNLPVLEDVGGQTLAACTAEGCSLMNGAEEWSRALRDEFRGIERNPWRLKEIEERLSQLNTAFKKFARDEEALVRLYEEITAKLKGLRPAEQLGKLQSQMGALGEACLKTARSIQQKRKNAARKLSAEINSHLEMMEMPGGLFDVSVHKPGSEKDLGPRGFPGALFTLCTTPGAPPHPMGEIASGGERSRALLAVCATLAPVLSAPLLVFDEIDTSIGSRLGKP